MLYHSFSRVALLNGELDKSKRKGKINLPLTPDYINRPMQMVSKDGKPAQTIYEVVEVVNGLTRIHFYPVTVSLIFLYPIISQETINFLPYILHFFFFYFAYLLVEIFILMKGFD